VSGQHPLVDGAYGVLAEALRWLLGSRRLTRGEWLISSEHGDIVCEHVVNAVATYARQKGQWVRLKLPAVGDDRLVSGYTRMQQKSAPIGIYEKTNPRHV